MTKILSYVTVSLPFLLHFPHGTVCVNIVTGRTLFDNHLIVGTNQILRAIRKKFSC